MRRVISIGSVRTAGTTTLALTLAGVSAAAGNPTVLIDAARNAALSNWAAKGRVPNGLRVDRAESEAAVECLMRAARRRGDVAIVDAGGDIALIRAAARFSDRTVVPLLFTPASVCAAVLTDRLLAADEARGTPGRDRVFAASAIGPVPASVAGAIEASLASSATPRLGAGLCERAVYSTSLLLGGTIFTQAEGAFWGADQAQAEAALLALEIGLLGPDTHGLLETVPLRRAA